MLKRIETNGTVRGAGIGVAGLSKSFVGQKVIDDIDLDIATGEVVALLGPSGCGKTTLLRMLAGLEEPSAGQILIGNETVADAGGRRFLPPERRSIGMVFQDYALWPHMSVGRNVAFPLEMKRTPRTDRGRLVDEALRLVGLDGLADRMPGTLSGGQQQRVALARAVVSKPSVVLFDEPLSNLDRELRESLVVDIAALVRSLGLTAVYVTHDHAEAFAIADRVALLSRGKLIQLAAPEVLTANPAGADVARFLKLGFVAAAACEHGAVALTGAASRLSAPQDFGKPGEGHLFVPGSALRLTETGEGMIAGRTVHSLFRGGDYLTRVRIAAGLDIDVAGDRRVADDSEIGIEFAWKAARWFASERDSSDTSIKREGNNNHENNVQAGIGRACRTPFCRHGAGGDADGLHRRPR